MGHDDDDDDGDDDDDDDDVTTTTIMFDMAGITLGCHIGKTVRANIFTEAPIMWWC